MSRMSRFAAATATLAALAVPVSAHASSHRAFVDTDTTYAAHVAKAHGHKAHAAKVRRAKAHAAKVRRAKAHAADQGCAGADQRLNGRQLDVARRATLCLLNQERAHYGLAPLAANSQLQTAAWGHSRDMVKRRYFEHGQFVTRIMNSGYLSGFHSYTVGENIAWGAGPSQTPAEMVNDWMHSPPHRANILSRSYHQIGVGVALGTPTGYEGGTYTTDFGLRQ